MGTRADFYVGRGEDAEWLGSIAWDGYPTGLPDLWDSVADRDERQWRQCVSDEFGRRDDATLPEQGWPWPWDDSQTTDYAYAFDGGKVWASCFGHGWFEIDRSSERYGEPDSDLEDGKVVFPDMSERKNVRYDNASGAIFLTRRSVGGGGDDAR